jgi:hypothetical protein
MPVYISWKASGGRWDRPEHHRLLNQLRNGDVLVAWKLDRLSRSLRDVFTISEQLPALASRPHSNVRALRPGIPLTISYEDSSTYRSQSRDRLASPSKIER